jgi:ribosomal peptide maturation radical SAM protein 1
MLKVSLVNMPFAALNLPSIGLTQLKSVLDEKFGGRVSAEIHYLNHDFALYLSTDFYKEVTGSLEHHNSGLGEWFFRQAAFPGETDNAEEYFGRYYPRRDERTRAFTARMRERRRGLVEFLDGLITKYALDDADVAGFTSMFSQNVASFAMARRIKERNPRVTVVMGGANCEYPMGVEIVSNVPPVDYVFAGQALISFPAFVANYLDGVAPAAGIKGVFARPEVRFGVGGRGNVNGNGGRSLAVLGECGGGEQQFTAGEELALDAAVPLDYDSFLEALERNFPGDGVKPVLLFETSRGCWWGQKAHCTFCGLNGQTMTYRSMSAEKALTYFESIFRYAPRAARFNSVDNILPKEYLTDVLPRLSVPENVSMFYEVKADLDEEEMAVLARARVTGIQPGIESFATSTLKLMKKGTSSFVNLRLLKNCLVYGIKPEWNLLIGFPGEGEEVYEKYARDLRLLVHLPPPHGVFPVRFDRFSPYYVQAEAYGLDLHPMDFYALTYPFPQESLENLAYYFTDQNVTADYFMAMARWINKVEAPCRAWRERWTSEANGVPPALYFLKRSGATVVFDSRSSEAVEREVSEAGLRILEKIAVKPGRLSDFGACRKDSPGTDPEEELAALQRAGLVFQEHDRFLSLVLPGVPAPLLAGR